MPTMMTLALILLLLPCSAFISPACTAPQALYQRSSNIYRLFAQNPFIRNEFSRLIPVDKLRSKRFNSTLIATPDECAALALRFQLVQLASLEATIQLRQEPTSSIIILEGGVIKAQLTQTCVRTAELFTEHVEFNMERAVVVQPQVEEQPLQRTLSNKKNDKPVKKKSKKTSYSYTDIDFDSLSLFQDDADADAQIEDDAIYPGGGGDGRLDAGELVAQLFFLSLDPYPKKPVVAQASFE
jgi:hypothetical protein